MWIKISEGLYAREAENPVEVVSLEELERECGELEAKVEMARGNLIPVPEKADSRVIAAIDEKNQFAQGEEIMFETQLAEKQALLNELKAL